jgi:putative phosphoesterase
MKIGVVSDTHSLDIPSQVLTAFRGVDLIVHAGDFCCLDDWKVLAAVKEVKAVYGNMDGPKIRKMFPEKLVFSFGGFRIGVCHGEGPRGGVLDRVKAGFAGETLDAVIFGHSHQPLNERIDGVLYFNPGSPNDLVSAPYRSYGILEARGKKLTGRIITING